MKIIGHRGAAGIALENSIQSIRAALAAGVDAIEIDVRLTADMHLVLSHDPTLRRVSKHRLTVKKETISKLKTTRLKNGETVPTLVDALKACKNIPLIVEAKSKDWALVLAQQLKKTKPGSVIVFAQDYAELHIFHELLPDIPVYLVQRFNPIDVLQAIHQAKRSHFSGVTMNFWLLNPLTYWLARRYKLDIIVYTVNHVWIARFLAYLFPDISIATNKPQHMQFLRSGTNSTTLDTTGRI